MKLLHHIPFFLISLLLTFTVQSQTRLTDAESGKPIPFAHIYLQSSGAGTVSNINGYFYLSLPAKPDTLQVSCIGYSPLLLPVGGNAAKLPAILKLKPSSQMLQELVIGDTGPKA